MRQRGMRPAAHAAAVLGLAAGALRPATLKAEPAAGGNPSSGATAPRSAITPGIEYYFGLTNYTGRDRRSTDGGWAGAEPFYPSNVSLSWRRGASAARVSLGVGDMYSGPRRTLEQPIEAWYQAHAGGGQITAGKYYTPFGIQEWQWEPKYGLMYAASDGRFSYSASFQYNTRLDRPNVYLRLGHPVNGKTTVGISGAAGRGLSYNSSHDVAFGLDLTHDLRGARLVSEYFFADGPHGQLHFVFGKLTWTRLGNWAPYVALYYWHDGAGELGSFRSAVLGTAYRLTPDLSLEPNLAQTSDHFVYWVQAHLKY